MFLLRRRGVGNTRPYDCTFTSRYYDDDDGGGVSHGPVFVIVAILLGQSAITTTTIDDSDDDNERILKFAICRDSIAAQVTGNRQAPGSGIIAIVSRHHHDFAAARGVDGSIITFDNDDDDSQEGFLDFITTNIRFAVAITAI